MMAAAVAAVIGHMFPVWLEFRGGKGVATGLGVFLAHLPGAVARGSDPLARGRGVLAIFVAWLDRRGRGPAGFHLSALCSAARTARLRHPRDHLHFPAGPGKAPLEISSGSSPARKAASSSRITIIRRTAAGRGQFVLQAIFLRFPLIHSRCQPFRPQSARSVSGNSSTFVPLCCHLGSISI